MKKWGFYIVLFLLVGSLFSACGGGSSEAGGGGSSNIELSLDFGSQVLGVGASLNLTASVMESGGMVVSPNLEFSIVGGG